MPDSIFVYNSHNVSNLVYHFVCPTKYRRIVISHEVDNTLKQICEGIELRYDWIRFLEIGTDGDHVHFLIQSTPDYSPTKIITTVKSIIAKRIFAEHPEVKKQLWSDEYLVSSTGKNTSEKIIKEYVKNQGKQDSYKQLLLKL